MTLGAYKKCSAQSHWDLDLGVLLPEEEDGSALPKWIWPINSWSCHEFGMLCCVYSTTSMLSITNTMIFFRSCVPFKSGKWVSTKISHSLEKLIVTKTTNSLTWSPKLTQTVTMKVIQEHEEEMGYIWNVCHWFHLSLWIAFNVTSLV